MQPAPEPLSEERLAELERRLMQGVSREGGRERLMQIANVVCRNCGYAALLMLAFIPIAETSLPDNVRFIVWVVFGLFFGGFLTGWYIEDAIRREKHTSFPECLIADGLLLGDCPYLSDDDLCYGGSDASVICTQSCDTGGH